MDRTQHVFYLQLLEKTGRITGPCKMEINIGNLGVKQNCQGHFLKELYEMWSALGGTQALSFGIYNMKGYALF